jgi:transcriptional regulator NrdR family protein
MSIICMHCKPKRTNTFPARLVHTPSRVIESRVVHAHVTVDGRTARTRSMRRTRECQGCGYRWRTIEYAIPAKRGRSHGQFGKRKETKHG